MLKMDDEIAFTELTEIDLSAVATLAPLQPPPAMDRKTADEFICRKDDKIGSGKAKATAERSFDESDVGKRLGWDNFPKALNFSLGLKINCNVGLLIAPFL